MGILPSQEGYSSSQHLLEEFQFTFLGRSETPHPTSRYFLLFTGLYLTNFRVQCWVEQDSSGAARAFWGRSFHRQSLFPCFFPMTPRVLSHLQQQRYLSQFNSSHTHLAFVVLPCSCVCAKAAACVWSQNERDQGKKVWLRENF